MPELSMMNTQLLVVCVLPLVATLFQSLNGGVWLALDTPANFQHQKYHHQWVALPSLFFSLELVYMFILKPFRMILKSQALVLFTTFLSAEVFDKA